MALFIVGQYCSVSNVILSSGVLISSGRWNDLPSGALAHCNGSIGRNLLSRTILLPARRGRYSTTFECFALVNTQVLHDERSLIGRTRPELPSVGEPCAKSKCSG